MVTIFEAAKAPIQWEEQRIGKEVDPETNSFVTRAKLGLRAEESDRAEGPDGDADWQGVPVV